MLSFSGSPYTRYLPFCHSPVPAHKQRQCLRLHHGDNFQGRNMKVPVGVKHPFQVTAQNTATSARPSPRRGTLRERVYCGLDKSPKRVYTSTAFPKIRKHIEKMNNLAKLFIRGDASRISTRVYVPPNPIMLNFAAQVTVESMNQQLFERLSSALTTWVQVCINPK